MIEDYTKKLQDLVEKSKEDVLRNTKSLDRKALKYSKTFLRRCVARAKNGEEKYHQELLVSFWSQEDLKKSYLINKIKSILILEYGLTINISCCYFLAMIWVIGIDTGVNNERINICQDTFNRETCSESFMDNIEFKAVEK